MAGPLLYRLNRIAQPVEDLLSLHSVIDVAGFGLFRSPQYRSADVVHLQLMHGRPFFSLLHLPRLAREKPVAWTIHDPWLTTGHCVHPLACGRWRSGCGQCPDLSRDFQMRADRTALNWRIKRDALAKAPMTLVFASRWMQQQAAASPILRHLPYEIIPFGVDPALFSPGSKQAARATLGIPDDADVFAFRASERPQAFKGTGYLVQALTAYRPRRKTYLLTFDQMGGLSTLRERFSLIEHGWVGDRESVVRALQAADLFLMPSTAESFGVMAVESMACGVPVVCFEGTALPDVIGAPSTGVAVAYGDHGALRRAIEDLMDNQDLRRAMGAEALKRVLREYTMDRYVERHLALYERLVLPGTPWSTAEHPPVWGLWRQIRGDSGA